MPGFDPTLSTHRRVSTGIRRSYSKPLYTSFSRANANLLFSPFCFLMRSSLSCGSKSKRSSSELLFSLKNLKVVSLLERGNHSQYYRHKLQTAPEHGSGGILLRSSPTSCLRSFASFCTLLMSKRTSIPNDGIGKRF